MTEHFDVVIVGAGIGGLATGSMLAQQGRKVLVLDRHTKPGGYATNFERDGFTFDVALHALNGATPGTPPINAWRPAVLPTVSSFFPRKTFTA